MLTLLLGEHLRDRDRGGRFADATLEVDKAQNVSFLTLEALDPSFDRFAVPDRPALKLLKRLRK